MANNDNTNVPSFGHEEIYLNLTNGLEYLEPLISKCTPKEGELKGHPVPMKVIRIPSSWIAEHKYDLLFINLDTDFLFHLAMGDKCIVFDCGAINADKDHSREPDDKICPSRAQWAGLALVEYVLNRLWFHKLPERVIVKDLNVKRYFDEIYSKHLSKTTFEKLRYFQRFIPEGVSAVSLDYRSKPAEHDKNYKWYSAIARVCL